MKNFSKVLLIFLLFLTVKPSFAAQGYDKIFFTGMALYQKGCEKEAVTEFKRYIFLKDYGDVNLFSVACTYVSIYYENHKMYDEALLYSNMTAREMSSRNLSPSVMEKYYLRNLKLLSLKATKNEEWLERDETIHAYINFNRYTERVKQFAWIVLIKNDLENWEWDKALSNFEEFSQRFPNIYSEETQAEFKKQIDEIKKAKKKNPTTAAWLSILPGLGQVYAGNPKDGLNAFLLNGTLITATVFSIITQNYADVILVEAGLVVRFYRGNIYNAQMETIKYNKKLNDEYVDKITNLLFCTQNIIPFEKIE